MIAAVQTLDAKTTQFLNSTVKINGQDVKIGKLAELVNISPNDIAQELSSITQSSNGPTPNISRLGLYVGLAELDISIGHVKSTSITINFSDPLKVDFAFNPTVTTSSTGQRELVTIDVSSAIAKDLGIDLKKIKLLRSSVHILDSNGDITNSYTAFNLDPSSGSVRCLERLCDPEQQHIHKYTLQDLADLICEGATIITHARRFNSDPVVVYLQRN